MRAFATAFFLLPLVALLGCGAKPTEPSSAPTTKLATEPTLSDADARELAKKNLKEIGLALHDYSSAMGRFPTAGTTADGKGLSWRVQILPHLGKDGTELFKKFHQFEPWDSPHNKTLIDQMPAVFASPGKPAGNGQTHVRGFVGPSAFLHSAPPPGGMVPLNFGVGGDRPAGDTSPKVTLTNGRTFGEMGDGWSNVLFVAEAAEPVIWTKPDDLPFDGGKDNAKAAVPKLGGLFADGFHGLMGDGRVYFFPKAVTTDDLLRGLITINGGEFVDLNPIRKANGEKEVEYRKPVTTPPTGKN